MRASAAARRYAKALLELAREEDRVEPVREALARLGELLDASPDLARALFHPLHPAAERRGALRAVARRLDTSPTVERFYAYLVDQRRFVDFPAIRAAYEQLAAEAAGRMRARVVVAGELSQAQRERLREALRGRTGRDVELEVEVDPALIGGAVARVGDLVYDGSIRTQLAQLHASLTTGSA